MITEEQVREEYLLVLANKVNQLNLENLQLRAQISAMQKQEAAAAEEEATSGSLKEVIKQQTHRSHKQ